MFLLTDTQIKEESFLEDVDGLLNAGEVPNLFELDEKQEILEVEHVAHMCNIIMCMCWYTGHATPGSGSAQGCGAHPSLTL